MKAIPALVLCGFLAGAGLQAAQATWDEQNQAMGYLIMHISSINAVNGLNLSRPQAQKLRDLAADLEKVCSGTPNLKAEFRPDLGEARDAYVELRQTLIKGAEVTPELEQKVFRARAIESAVVRLSIAAAQPKATGCLRCHGQPAVADGRPQLEKALGSQEKPAQFNQRELFFAHMNGVFSPRGLLKLATLTPTVDAVLTEAQKEAVSDFSCCLIPPKSMSDPVRAGQAAAGDREMEVLRAMRGVPETLWPVVKKQATDKLELMLAAKQPGITAAEKAAARERITKLCDKVRAMPDTEFEMEKEKLAGELKGGAGSAASLDSAQRRYMTALFLLVPGSSEAYASLLTRMDEKEKTGR